jgi:aryl-alcohol dehydrogenase-like predicted oxidoreductase
MSMDLRRFGRTGLMVSPFTMGTMEFGSKVDETEASRLLNSAVEAGVNCVDTANVYASGRSEEILGRPIGARRDRLILATKSARCLKALSLAWVVYSHRTGKTHHAFKLGGK